jgi:hypothetical protein
LPLYPAERKKNNLKDEGLEENGLIIKMSGSCGWCGGYDSLKISESAIYYAFNDPCGDADSSNNWVTNKDDWNELIGLLDLLEFKKVNVNTCYVCVDGCDTWISVKSEYFFHEIRFGDYDSLTVQPIQPFIDKLYDIRSHLTEK